MSEYRFTGPFYSDNEEDQVYRRIYQQAIDEPVTTESEPKVMPEADEVPGPEAVSKAEEAPETEAAPEPEVKPEPEKSPEPEWNHEPVKQEKPEKKKKRIWKNCVKNHLYCSDCRNCGRRSFCRSYLFWTEGAGD